MNSVQLVGRLVRDPEVRYSQGENPIAVARFTVACNRKFKKEGEQDADFISCVAFGKVSEFVERYFQKGSSIGLNGRIQTGSYTNKDGQKVYTTDVFVESVEFVGSKNENQAGNNEATKKNDDFMNIPDNIDEELPFN